MDYKSTGRINFKEISIAGVDGGKNGGLYISSINMTVPMPIIEYTKKHPIYEIIKEKKRGHSKKQPVLIKSGINKGKPKLKKIIDKTTDYYINIKTLVDYNLSDVKIVVLEKAGQTHGSNSKKQTENIDGIKYAARMLEIALIEVDASRWKKHFKLNDDKSKCVDYANMRSGFNLKYKQDGEAESYLIHLWFVEFYESLNIGEKYNYTARTTKHKGKYTSKSISVTLIDLDFLTATVATATGYQFQIRVEELNKKIGKINENP